MILGLRRKKSMASLMAVPCVIACSSPSYGMHVMHEIWVIRPVMSGMHQQVRGVMTKEELEKKCFLGIPGTPHDFEPYDDKTPVMQVKMGEEKLWLKQIREAHEAVGRQNDIENGNHRGSRQKMTVLPYKGKTTINPAKAMKPGEERKWVEDMKSVHKGSDE